MSILTFYTILTEKISLRNGENMSAITPIEQDASLFAREMSDAYRDMCYADDGFKQFERVC